MVEKTLDRMAAGGMYDQVGGRLPPLLGRRALARAALREDALRQRDARPRVRPRAPRVRRRRLRARRPGDARLSARRDDACRRRILRGAGRRLGRRGRAPSTSGTRSRSRRPSARTRPRSSRRGSASRRRATSRAARRCFRSSGRFRSSPAEFGRPEEEIARILAEARARMYAVRGRRVRPGTDDKLLTDWTALAISAFALAGRVLSEPRYEERRAGRGRPDPRTLRARRPAAPPREGRAGRHPGLLDRLRVPHRGAARPLRGDFRAALLPGGRPAPGRLRDGLRGSRGRATTSPPRRTTASSSGPPSPTTARHRPPIPSRR